MIGLSLNNGILFHDVKFLTIYKILHSRYFLIIVYQIFLNSLTYTQTQCEEGDREVNNIWYTMIIDYNL